MYTVLFSDTFVAGDMSEENVSARTDKSWCLLEDYETKVIGNGNKTGLILRAVSNKLYCQV